MAKGNWKVFCQMIDGKKQYILGYQKDLNKPLENGNVVLVGLHKKDPVDLQREADFLNEYGVGIILSTIIRNERS